MFNIRKNNIKKRKRNIDSIKENRQNKIKENEERDTLKAEEYEKEKLQIEEDGGELNEEEFEAKFLLKNPEIVIPEDAEYDVDADYTFEEDLG